MKSRKRAPDSPGQTLIALLIFMLLGITVTTAAATITIINIRSSNDYSSGEQALANAESGVEDTLERLLRDPTYTGGSLAFPNGTVTISVSGTTVKIITSEGISNNFHRTVAVTATFSNNTFTVNSWSETP